MKQSLRQRLSLMLGGSIVLAGMLAGVVSFALAYQEAKEFQDDMLRQIALLEAPAGYAGAPPDAPAMDDPEVMISVLRLPGEPRPDWLPAELAGGFHTLEKSGERQRVFVRRDAAGRRLVVAQPTVARDEIALNSALRTLFPLLLLLPVMVWLVPRIVGRELAPVNRLAALLDAQRADRLQSLADDEVSDEIRPFVDAINGLLARVGELMHQQQRFIADAAHELRSPLAALLLQAQNLNQASSLENMRQRALPLQAAIERVCRLSEQLLSLARTRAGTAASSTVDVAAMARELIADFLPLAESKGVDLGLDACAPMLLVVRPEALRLVLRNGLENAVKYTPSGGEVTLRLDVDAGGACIDIVDSGPGIPAGERERLFAPFCRLSDASGEGSGLGLAIAREAAASLGGTLSLRDRPEGAGLVFRYRHGRPAAD